MPESPGLYLRLSVTENLECFAGLHESLVPRERIDLALRAVTQTVPFRCPGNLPSPLS